MGDVTKQKGERRLPLTKSGAGNESRTRDLNLGKVALYQLSYSRVLPPQAVSVTAETAPDLGAHEGGIPLLPWGKL